MQAKQCASVRSAIHWQPELFAVSTNTRKNPRNKLPKLVLTLPCCAVLCPPSPFCPAELVAHGDHFDRVPVWDATRSNTWENLNHYFGGWGHDHHDDHHDHDHSHGGWGRRWLLASNKADHHVDVIVVEPARHHHHHHCGYGLVGVRCWARKLMGMEA